MTDAIKFWIAKEIVDIVGGVIIFALFVFIFWIVVLIQEKRG